MPNDATTYFPPPVDSISFADEMRLETLGWHGSGLETTHPPTQAFGYDKSPNTNSIIRLPRSLDFFELQNGSGDEKTHIGTETSDEFETTNSALSNPIRAIIIRNRKRTPQIRTQNTRNWMETNQSIPNPNQRSCKKHQIRIPRQEKGTPPQKTI